LFRVSVTIGAVIRNKFDVYLKAGLEAGLDIRELSALRAARWAESHIGDTPTSESAVITSSFRVTAKGQDILKLIQDATIDP
jgi:hypothetical protein